MTVWTRRPQHLPLLLWDYFQICQTLEDGDLQKYKCSNAPKDEEHKIDPIRNVVFQQYDDYDDSKIDHENGSFVLTKYDSQNADENLDKANAHQDNFEGDAEHMFQAGCEAHSGVKNKTG